MPPSPPFDPHPLLPGGHAQTFATLLPSSVGPPSGTAVRLIDLPDGDAIALHDDRPAAWCDGDPVALLVHGLTGDHTSGYMQRIATRLVGCGTRCFRMDFRGSGAAIGRSHYPANAGRSEDARAALAAIRETCPGSSIAAAGFSLGGNLLLKLLGEDADEVAVECAVAVNAPVDLEMSIDALGRGANRAYDWYFARRLMRHVAASRELMPGLAWPRPDREPASVREFDEMFTAPLSGYRDATDYYTRCSAKPLLCRIAVPTLILAASDDPLVPPESFDGADLGAHVSLRIVSAGGHLGFLARTRGRDPDRRWMDARVVEWLTAHSGNSKG
jgi:predicted alpha/beta-fold hydrolase